MADGQQPTLWQHLFGMKQGTAIAANPTVNGVLNGLVSFIGASSPVANEIVAGAKAVWPGLLPDGTPIGPQPTDEIVITRAEWGAIEASIDANLTKRGYPTTGDADFIADFEADMKAAGVYK